MLGTRNNIGNYLSKVCKLWGTDIYKLQCKACKLRGKGTQNKKFPTWKSSKACKLQGKKPKDK